MSNDLEKIELNNIISYQTEICNQLAKVKTIEDVKTYKAWIKTLKTFVRNTKQKLEIKNLADEGWIRGLRQEGNILAEMKKAGELADKGGNGSNQHERANITEANISSAFPKTLADYDINPRESMMAQQIASIPDEDFEEEIKTIKEESEKNLAELTVARFSRLYKSLNKKDEPEHEKDINELVDDLAYNLQSFLNSFSQVVAKWEYVDEKRRGKLAVRLKRLISVFQELQENQKKQNSKKPKLLLITKEKKE